VQQPLPVQTDFPAPRARKLGRQLCRPDLAPACSDARAQTFKSRTPPADAGVAVQVAPPLAPPLQEAPQVAQVEAAAQDGERMALLISAVHWSSS